MEIIHHGARDGVTGSCHQLRMDDQHSLLIDCGLFQGAEVSAGTAGADRLTKMRDKPRTFSAGKDSAGRL